MSRLFSIPPRGTILYFIAIAADLSLASAETIHLVIPPRSG